MEKQIAIIVDSKLRTDITKKELKQIRRLCKIFPNINVDFDQIQLCKKESANIYDIIKYDDRILFLKDKRIFDDNMNFIGVEHNKNYYLFDKKITIVKDLNSQRS